MNPHVLKYRGEVRGARGEKERIINKRKKEIKKKELKDEILTREAPLRMTSEASDEY